MTVARRQLEEEPVADPAEIERLFRDSLRDWEIRPTGDGRVSEEVAGWLIGYDAGTMRNKRMMGSGPDAVRVGGKISYKLRTLAAWLAREMQPV